MKLSVGVIITDGKNIILGHSTGNDFWDIPKGLGLKNEAILDTVIRETIEEFNIDLSDQPLIDCGLHGYIKDKQLHIFKAIVDEMPDPIKCKCQSFFTTFDGITYPEINGYEVFTISDGLLKMTKSLKRVIEKLV